MIKAVQTKHGSSQKFTIYSRSNGSSRISPVVGSHFCEKQRRSGRKMPSSTYIKDNDIVDDNDSSRSRIVERNSHRQWPAALLAHHHSGE
jgi:hypothetical protein